jgi:hypothetical protein
LNDRSRQFCNDIANVASWRQQDSLWARLDDGRLSC